MVASFDGRRSCVALISVIEHGVVSLNSGDAESDGFDPNEAQNAPNRQF